MGIKETINGFFNKLPFKALAEKIPAGVTAKVPALGKLLPFANHIVCGIAAAAAVTVVAVSSGGGANPEKIAARLDKLYEQSAEAAEAGDEAKAEKLEAEIEKLSAALEQAEAKQAAKTAKAPKASGGGDVYAAGYEDNAEGVHIACYWKNGKKVELPDGAGFIAVGIAVSGDDVYVTGDNHADDNTAQTVFYFGPDDEMGEETKPSVACYWKNGEKIALTDGTTYAGVRGIAVLGEDVYVAGFETARDTVRACYWKNGEEIALSDGKAYATTRGIFAAGEDVYVAGRDRVKDTDRACYWKNGKKVALAKGKTHSLAACIAVVGKAGSLDGGGKAAAKPASAKNTRGANFGAFDQYADNSIAYINLAAGRNYTVKELYGPNAPFATTFQGRPCKVAIVSSSGKKDGDEVSFNAALLLSIQDAEGKWNDGLRMTAAFLADEIGGNVLRYIKVEIPATGQVSELRATGDARRDGEIVGLFAGVMDTLWDFSAAGK